MNDLALPKNAHLWARHPQDWWYVEPEWTSERLFAVEKFEGGILDPACGLGRIVRSAEKSGLHAVGMDIEPRSDAVMIAIDFLSGDFPWEILDSESGGECQNIASNPPFGCADRFIEKALRITPDKVAMLLPTRWMNGAARGAWLETTPLLRVWLLGPRPSMPPGPVIEAGEKPGNGTIDFAWFVWQRGYAGKPHLGWLRK